MCGYFMTAPVVGQQKMAGEKVYMIGNESTLILFKGNIIILINSNSASASEFFTNAMQDYNLAIVLGTKSYGKASIQEIFELENDAKDFLKITIGTFYRVTGSSNQAVGITPNIIIPSIYENQIQKEKDADRHLKNENIKPYISSNSFPLSENQKMSIQTFNLEVKKNNTYKEIEKLKSRLNNLFSDKMPSIRLNINDVYDNMNKYNLLWKDIQNFEKVTYDFDIFKNSFDVDKGIKQESLINTDKIGVKKLKSNFAVFESLQILQKLQ